MKFDQDRFSRNGLAVMYTLYSTLSFSLFFPFHCHDHHSR